MKPLPGDSPESFRVFKGRVGAKLLELERLTASLRGRLADCSDQDYASESLHTWLRWVDDTSKLHPDPRMGAEYRRHLCEVFYDHCRPVLARKQGWFSRPPSDEKKMTPILKLEKHFATQGQSSKLSASTLVAEHGASAAARNDFAYFLVDDRPDTGLPKARLTINFDSQLAPRAIKAVAELYRNRAFQAAKVRSPSNQGQTGDNALMYLVEPVKDLGELDRLLARFPHLKTDRFVPPGTLPTGKPGVGYSEFPDGSSTSHLLGRIPVLLDALRSRDLNPGHPEVPLGAYLQDALRKHGFDPARPWARAAAPSADTRR
jgi:hypothetical protein